MQINRIYLFLLFIIAFHFSINANSRFSLMLGPSWTKNIYEIDKFRLGYSILVLNDQRLSNKSYISYGIGFNHYEWKKEYDIDTNFPHVSSPNGCNCKIFNRSVNWSEIVLPLNYKYFLFQNVKYRLAISGGLEFAPWKYYKSHFAYYVRDEFDNQIKGPYEDTSVNRETSESFVQPSISISFDKSLKENFAISSSFSYTLSNELQKLRLIVGITFGR